MTDLLELRKFVVPEFVFGAGARHLVGRYAVNLGTRKALVVTDAGVIEAGWAGQVVADLEAAGVACALFSEVTPNPTADEVMAGAELYRSAGCNALVAVGGGSPMDCAKGIGVASSSGEHVLTFEGVDEVPVPGPPLICVPTTAGTSADVSQFAIITDPGRQVKIAIVSKTVVPDVALIDPVTTTTMDAHLTACTGMDALVHAIEAYVSNASSPVTDLHALEAVRLVTGNLPSAITHPEDLNFRGKMMLGSLHAGLAFSNASLGAVHALAHSLGGFLDFAHGQANAILLPYVIAFNYEVTPRRYAEVGKAMGLELEGLGDEEAKSALLEKVYGLQRIVGVHEKLGEVGLREADIPALAKKAMRDACMVTNPRRPSRREVEEIYEQAI